MNISYVTIAIKNPSEIRDGHVLLLDEQTGAYYAASINRLTKDIESAVEAKLSMALKRISDAERAISEAEARISEKSDEMDRKYEANLAKQKEINAKVIEVASALSEGE